MGLKEQIDLVIKSLPSRPKHFIVRPAKPKRAGGKARHLAGKHVEWKHSRFGWDALLWDKHGHVLNAINYGLPEPPTEGQKREAERLLLSSVDPKSPLNRRGGGKRRSPRAGGKARHGSIGNIEDETPLMPWIVSDGVVQEVVGYLSEHGLEQEAEKLYTRRDAIGDAMTNKANSIYKHNPHWRKKINGRGNTGLAYLRMFIMHWMASDLRKTQPVVFCALPPRFAMGEELR